MQCDRCASERFIRAGRDRHGRQLYRCVVCGRRMTTRSGSAFRGYRFPDDIIALAVRWWFCCNCVGRYNDQPLLKKGADHAVHPVRE